MLWLLLIIPLIILVLLIIPVVIKLTVRLDDGLVLQARLCWVVWTLRQWQYQLPEWGTLAMSQSGRPSSASSQSVPPSAPKSAAKTGAAESTASVTKRRLPTWSELETYWALLQKHFPRAWRALHLRLAGTWQLQVSDPAAMGWLFAATAAFNWPKPPVQFEIDYSESTRLSGDVQLAARLFPAQLLWLSINFAWEKPIRALILARLKQKGEKQVAGSQKPGRTTRKPHIQQDRHRGTDISG